MTDSRDSQQAIYDGLIAPRVDAVNEKLKGTGMKLVVEPIRPPLPTPSAPALSPQEIYQAFGLDETGMPIDDE